MRLAVVQTNPVFGEVESNLTDALALMESTHADLYVLPELFATGYNFLDAEELSRFAEEAQGRTFTVISGFAKRRVCYVVYGFAEQSDRIYNSAALVGPPGFVGIYRKVHLYDRETLMFTPGNLGYPVFDLPFGRIGIMICFDWIYPEAARTLALAGAQLIAHPSNLVLPYCPDAMVTRCLENRVFAATANRIGKENRGGLGLSFIGNSEILSPRGEILARLGNDEVGLAFAEIDLRQASDKRINDLNDLLRDRRVDQYSLLG